MMTTFFDFKPSSAGPFQFQPVLDGETYNASVPWLLFGARYYLNLLASDGTQVLYRAIAGSPTGVAIQTLSWSAGRVSVLTAEAHGYKLGRTIALTIAGCSPVAYNGIIEALITGPNTFTYALSSDPGQATVFGNANYDVNLLGGVLNENGVAFSSTLVFREQSQQFEVSP